MYDWHKRHRARFWATCFHIPHLRAENIRGKIIAPTACLDNVPSDAIFPFAGIYKKMGRAAETSLKTRNSTRMNKFSSAGPYYYKSMLFLFSRKISLY
jgi:hypothetical protein